MHVPGTGEVLAWPPCSFGDVSPLSRARVFGVDYAIVEPPLGGELFVTQFGWPILDHVLPERWYSGHKLPASAQRLEGGTGSVYRVPTTCRRGRAVDLVVKFSRFAQELPLGVSSTFPEDLWQELMVNARFNSPFEEFAMLMKLRQTKMASAPSVLTKRPLAIYCPPQRYQAWQLGRSSGEFITHKQRLGQCQEENRDGQAVVSMDPAREYVLLFGWVKGMDAQEMYERGVLSHDEMCRLSLQVAADLRRRGFQVLDNKPRHFILRQSRRDGQLLRRHGKLVYALIDFELLVEVKGNTSPTAQENAAN